MANSVAGRLRKSTNNIGKTARPKKSSGVDWSLYDARGRRKYLLPIERRAFMASAIRTAGDEGTFAATLAISGCRISEALALRAEQIDERARTINFISLKKRKAGVIRTVPVPCAFLDFLDYNLNYRERQRDATRAKERLWPWSRTTGWRRIKEIMQQARVAEFISQPKALRHAFGIDASRNKIAPGLTQLWMGHAKLETTMIYATPMGAEERALAALMWKGFTSHLNRHSSLEKLQKSR